jgi:hypothetical protein
MQTTHAAQRLIRESNLPMQNLLSARKKNNAGSILRLRRARHAGQASAMGTRQHLSLLQLPLSYGKGTHPEMTCCSSSGHQSIYARDIVDTVRK